MICSHHHRRSVSTPARSLLLPAALCVGCLLLSGCSGGNGGPVHHDPQPAVEIETTATIEPEDAVEPQPEDAATPPVVGADWPRFLGPTGDGKSPETGIFTDWGQAGPPVVWHRRLGESYDIGTVSRGRYYQFDRVGDRAVLDCLDAETGELLWEFGYPTDYVDHYNYNGGPRCSPIVDGEQLTFTRGPVEDDPITDVQTGSTWDITGRAIDGPLAGSELEPVPHGDHFWFAWAAFVPETSIWTPEGLRTLDGNAA